MKTHTYMYNAKEVNFIGITALYDLAIPEVLWWD